MNECLESDDICPDNTTECRNTWGSFECLCKKGFMEVNLKCVCELLINAKILPLIDCFKYIFTLFLFLSLLVFSVFFVALQDVFEKRDNDSGVYLLDSTEANHGSCIGRSQVLHLFC